MYIHNAKLGLTNPAASINHNWPRKCLHIKKEKDPLDWSTPLINQPLLLKSHFLDAPISWFSKSLLIPVVSHHVSSKLIVTDLWKSPHFPNDWFQIRFFKTIKTHQFEKLTKGTSKNLLSWFWPSLGGVINPNLALYSISIIYTYVIPHTIEPTTHT